MKRHALFFSTFTAVMLALPAFAADDASGLMEVRWGKNAFNFEGMPSGPQPLHNLSRLPNGKANNRQLVGDYRNPILTPEAAAVRSQRLRRVAALMAQLPKEQRLGIQLRMQGLRYRAIAKILGVSLSTTAEWLSSAVERLRNIADE